MLKKIADFIDPIVKVIGAFIFFCGLLTFVPIVERATKAVTGSLFGQTGSVYMEVDSSGNAWINSKGHISGSVVAINQNRRQVDQLRWGDTLRVVSNGNFREAPVSDPGQVTSWTDLYPSIFVLRVGECLVFQDRYEHKPENNEASQEKHGSFGYLKASTVACGIFN